MMSPDLGADMILGEHASLQALRAVVPSLCPLSLGFGKLSLSSNYFLLTEFLDVNAQTSEMGSGLSFAQKLAKLHSAPVPTPEGHNQVMFGFPITTYAGRTKQDNTFRRSWAKFYAENRLRTISKLIEQAHGTDDELRMWIERTAAEIVPKLLGNGHLGGRKGISPALVHGDLWSGNKARGRLGGKGGVEDVAFDASCCYAHSEYELGLMRMFGGFSAGFFSEYHRLIPKTSPQNEYEDRMKLYQL
jgi:protein-ribulosamine 3-kinase